MSSGGFWKAIQGTSESSTNDEKLCYDVRGTNDRERAVAVRVASCFLPVIILQSLTMRMPSSSLDSHAVARKNRKRHCRLRFFEKGGGGGKSQSKA